MDRIFTLHAMADRDQNMSLLECNNLTKRFPGVTALNHVDFTLAANEVLAVIGENGAGKSTLMKILAGVQIPDSGSIQLNEKRVSISNVRVAQELGISLIHQELNLADNLSVAENIFLGREFSKFGVMNWNSMYEESIQWLQKVGLDVSPKTQVSRLSIGQQQLVEIAKALSCNARILIMDEPTSSLSQSETETLFSVIDDLKKTGVSVIYISHRLGEVKRLADRVTVLRDGQNSGELSKDQIDHESMVRLMVGRDLSQFYERTSHPTGKVSLAVRDLTTTSWPKSKLNFEMREGEIVGIAGLVGSGRTEVLRAIFGLGDYLSGQMELFGKPVQISNTTASIKNRLALVPEDRKEQGVLLEESIRSNISLAGLSQNAIAGMMLNFDRERSDSQQMIGRLNIKTPSDRTLAGQLSGGNQQKVVLGKWLALDPKILLLDEPTRGVDIGAKHEIYKLMDRLAGEGRSILFVSSEMEEILGMSDRVLVMSQGIITGCLNRDELSEEQIMQLATKETVTISS